MVPTLHNSRQFELNDLVQYLKYPLMVVLHAWFSLSDIFARSRLAHQQWLEEAEPGIHCKVKRPRKRRDPGDISDDTFGEAPQCARRCQGPISRGWSWVDTCPWID
jgi:hypothetical protein